MARRLLLFTLLSVILVAVVQLTAGMRHEAAEARYPANGKRIDVDGVKIHVDVRGSGPDLVMIHGASGNTRDLTFSLAEALEDRYRVILIDRPGLGWSQQPDGYGGLINTAGESPAVQAKIMHAAAQQVGLNRPIVLGHSLGGAVAMAWAQSFDDTAAVVMVAGVSHPWPGNIDGLHRLNGSRAGGMLVVPLISAFVPRWYVEGAVGSIFAPMDPPDGYMDHVGAPLSLRRPVMRANSRQVVSLRPHIVQMHETYPELTLPIEAVHGDADTIVPLDVHSVPLAERIESANLVVLEGVGHMPQHQDEQAIIDAIDRAAARAGLR